MIEKKGEKCKEKTNEKKEEKRRKTKSKKKEAKKWKEKYAKKRVLGHVDILSYHIMFYAGDIGDYFEQAVHSFFFTDDPLYTCGSSERANVCTYFYLAQINQTKSKYLYPSLLLYWNLEYGNTPS